MEPDNLCSKCYNYASEDYLIDGECVCEECYFEFLDNDHVEQSESE